MSTPIAVLGTGLLGSAFVEAFIARGERDITVWNRTRAKAEPLAALGAKVVDTAAEAVQNADRIHLVLLDDDTVDETIQAIRGALKPGAVIVDHTTLRPDRTEARAAALDAAGLEYLHCPVMMGPPAVRAASGVMFVSGPTERFSRVKDALKVMTGEVIYLGERADMAAAHKLVGNAMSLMIAGNLADIFHLADAMKMPRPSVLDVFNQVKMENVVAVRSKKMLSEDYKPTFTLEVARKDVRLMIESAGSQSVPMLRALAANMDDAIGAGDGDKDVGVLSRRKG
ncbi:MAG: NAD(P)-binding domain-containing protein [Gemmatimonadaceae bacterium]